MTELLEKRTNETNELSRLRRVDLLELLVEATRENERLSDALACKTELIERLEEKLEQKDAQIESLITRLDEADARMAELKIRSTANAHAVRTVTAEELLEIERLAVKEYLKQVAEQNAQNGGDPQEGILVSLEPATTTAPRGRHSQQGLLSRKQYTEIQQQ